MQYLPWDQWQGKAETGLQLAAPAEVEPLDNRTLRFTISTSSPDRERDVVSVKGWKTASYMKNPVVMWAHDYKQPPIAKATDIRVIGDRLVATAEFVPKDLSPFADTIYKLIKAGFIKGTSVGFRPLKWSLNTERGGTDFYEQELLEFSITPIPAHPDALIEARSAGIDVAPLRAWAEETLKMDESDNAAIVVKAATEPLSTEVAPGTILAPDPVELPAEPTPAIAKAGRVLSGRNESALREGLAALNAAMGQLQTVLAQVETVQDEESAPTEAGELAAQAAAQIDALRPLISVTNAAEVAVEKDMVVLRLVDDPEPRFAIDHEVLSAVLAKGLLTSLATVVDARVGAALSALRGRID